MERTVLLLLLLFLFLPSVLLLLCGVQYRDILLQRTIWCSEQCWYILCFYVEDDWSCLWKLYRLMHVPMRWARLSPESIPAMMHDKREDQNCTVLHCVLYCTVLYHMVYCTDTNMHSYIQWVKKYTWLFIITLTNVDRFLEFFHQQIPKETLCDYYRVFHLTLTVFQHYLAKFKNPK